LFINSYNKYGITHRAGSSATVRRKLPDISQGSVATHLRYGGTFNDDYYKFTAVSLAERKLRARYSEQSH